MHVGKCKYITKTKSMYYTGIDNNDINKTKINLSSQWKQQDLGPKISRFL